MSKRYNNDPLDQLLALFEFLPWYIGFICVVIAFVFLRFVFPALLMMLPDPDITLVVFAQLFPYAAWFITDIILIVWFVAVIKKLVRRNERNQSVSDSYPPTTSSSREIGISCPECGAPMVKRTARKGSNAGSKFWGCSRFPECRGTRRWTSESSI